MSLSLVGESLLVLYMAWVMLDAIVYDLKHSCFRLLYYCREIERWSITLGIGCLDVLALSGLYR